MTNELARLRQLITTHFSLDEIATLCFDLGVNYDDLGEPKISTKVRELILHLGREHQLDRLLETLETERPGVFTAAGFSTGTETLDLLYAALPAFAAGRPSPQTRPRDQQILLQKVKAFWIEGVLEKSLHGAALLELGKEERPAAVEYPWEMVVQAINQEPRPVPPDQHIVNVFDEAGKSLLILGEPGSGKTTMLLELTRAMIARAEADPTCPIPVVFNLSSWTEKQPIAGWLVDELNEKYLIPKKIGRSWIENDQLLLLLDGLDEVKPELQSQCVTAINHFRQEHLVNIAACSRLEEYEAIATRLRLDSAIYLKPLTPEQINRYLEEGGDKLAAVRTALQSDTILQRLARSPLMLNIITLAYQNMPLEDLQGLDSIETRRQHLFAAYVKRMFLRRGAHDEYTPEQTIRWLSWLAQKMSRDAQTILIPERIQPAWLPGPDRRRLFALASLLIGAILFAIVGGLTDLLIFYLSPPEENLLEQPFSMFLSAASYAIVGILYVAIGLRSEIGVIENLEWSLRWSWRSVKNGLLLGALVALLWSLIFALFLPAAQIGNFTDGLVTGGGIGNRLLLFVLFAIIFGILFGYGGAGLGWLIFSSLHVEQRDAATTDKPGLWGSTRSMLIVILIVLLLGFPPGLLFGLAENNLYTGLLLGSNIILFLGLTVAMFYGGNDAIKRIVLHRILHREGCIPANLTQFLNATTDYVFLRRVGRGYIFMHRLLLDYFAGLGDADIFAKLKPKGQTQAGVISHLRALRQFIIEHYDLADFRALCHQFGIDYETLAGDSITARSGQFLLRLGRRRHFLRLLAQLQQARPAAFAQSGLKLDPAFVTSLYKALPSPEESEQLFEPRPPYQRFLLNQVKNGWVRGILGEPSLPGNTINLAKTYRPAAVAAPWPTQLPNSEPEPAVTEKSIIELFDESDRRLLILGADGAGKTTALLELARELIRQAEQDATLSLPVILDLSSWDNGDASLSDWLVTGLQKIYAIPPAVAQTWIQDQQLILLLDNLDAVDTSQQAATITAINHFCRQHASTDVALCTQAGAVETAAGKLELQSAICLQPLRQEQVLRYLDKIGDSVKGLCTAIQRGTGTLGRLARSPLLLKLMSHAYRDQAAEAIAAQTQNLTGHQQLLDTYITAMLDPPGDRPAYQPGAARRWLGWLARQMRARKQTVFFIEHLQPDWLQSTRQTWLYRLGTIIGAGLIIGLPMGLLLALTATLMFPVGTLLFWLPFGADAALWLGAITSLLVGLSMRRPLQPFRPINWSLRHWSWPNAAKSLPRGIAAGFAMETLWVLLRLPDINEAIRAQPETAQLGETLIVIFGLILYGIIISAILTLLVFGGLKRDTPLPARKHFNLGVSTAARSAFLVWLSILLLGIGAGIIVTAIANAPLIARLLRESVSATAIFSLIREDLLGWLDVGITQGAAFGVLFSLLTGGTDLLRHLGLRLTLTLTGAAPWNYGRFLDQAVQQNILYRVGRGYIFIHPQLQNHLAPPTQNENTHTP